MVIITEISTSLEQKNIIRSTTQKNSENIFFLKKTIFLESIEALKSTDALETNLLIK